jgi:preprotein translocase subunit YajC
MGVPPGGGAGGAGGPGGMFGALAPLLLMFLVFYFLLIRPQQKRTKQHRDFLDALQKGEEVITSGGIHGRVTGITDNVVTLEIADKVRIKVQRANIAGAKPRVPEKTG